MPPAAGLILAGLVAVAGAAGCARPAARVDRLDATARPGTATPWVVPAATTTAHPTHGAMIDRSRAIPLQDAPALTAAPTLAIDPAAEAPALAVSDQLGGEVQLLGSIDGDPLAAVGPRILRFGGHGGWSTNITATSPVLPGMPKALAVFGRRAVVATTRGLTVLDLDSDPMRIFSNLALGEVFAVAMHGSTALALPVDGYDPKGRLVLVDLEDPAQPRILRTVGLPTSAHRIAVFGDTVFLSPGRADPIVLDLTVPDRPVLLRSGPWPWPKDGPPEIRHFQKEGQYLLVVDQPASDDADRRCLYLFTVDDGGNPTLVQTDTCPFGSVQWAHIVGRMVVLRYDHRTDVLRIGEPRERKSLDEVFGNRFDYYPLSKTTAIRVGDDVLVAPIHSYAIGRVDALRITVAGDGKLTHPAINGNSIDLQVRSVRSFDSVVAEDDTLAAVTGQGSVAGSALEWLQLTDHGTIEQVGDSLPVDLAAAGSHVYVAAGWAGLIVLTAEQSTGD